jgi:hypothetical protein
MHPFARTAVHLCGSLGTRPNFTAAVRPYQGTPCKRPANCYPTRLVVATRADYSMRRGDHRERKLQRATATAVRLRRYSPRNACTDAHLRQRTGCRYVNPACVWCGSHTKVDLETGSRLNCSGELMAGWKLCEKRAPSLPGRFTTCSREAGKGSPATLRDTLGCYERQLPPRHGPDAGVPR